MTTTQANAGNDLLVTVDAPKDGVFMAADTPKSSVNGF